MATAQVRVQDLHKSYGAVQSVRGVSFEASAGEIFGLLGPNGAGKTTTLECATGLRRFDSGAIEVCGIDVARRPQEVKAMIGVQLQATALQDAIEPREALKLFASFYQSPLKADDLLEKFSLTQKAGARFSTLSGGQKQRLAIALALVGDPRVLVLDEPTANLDPQARRELHEVMRTLRAEGRTLVLATHYIEEAEQLCDRLAIIDHGKVIAEGRPAELIARAAAHSRIRGATRTPLEPSALAGLAGVVRAEADQAQFTLSTIALTPTLLALVKLVEQGGNELVDVQTERPSLEDVFIELTGRSIRS